MIINIKMPGNSTTNPPLNCIRGEMSSGKLETLLEGGQGVKVSEGAVRWRAVGLRSMMTQLQRRGWRVDTVNYTLAIALGTCRLRWSYLTAQ